MKGLFAIWKKSEDPATKGTTETASDILMRTNEAFKSFLLNCSWVVYLIAGCLILCSIFYYIYDCKRRLHLRRQRQELQRTSERVAQRRRPGAAYRDHQIFRNVVQICRQYIAPKYKTKNVKHRPYMLKRTRSGRIYGHYCDQETENE